MAITAEGNKSVIDGDGSTTVFTFAFDALTDAEVAVYTVSAADAETLQTSNYTVDRAAKTVTYPNSGDALLATEKIVIVRNATQTQPVDLKQQGAFDAEAMEDALDRVTMICQDLQEQIDRCFKVGVQQTVSGTSEASFIAAINALYPIYASGTFEAQNTLAVANPTVPRFAYLTDMGLLAFYTGDSTVGTQGWFFLGGGG